MSIFGSRTVTILVGSSQKPFYIHLGLLKNPRAGEFFNSTFSVSSFNKNKAGPVMLPEEDPTIFEYYTKWLYSSVMHDSAPNDFIYDLSGRELVKLYILAHKRGVFILQNTVITQLHHVFMENWFNDMFDRELLDEFSARVPSPSHMHNLLTAWAVRHSLQDSINLTHLLPDVLLRPVLESIWGTCITRGFQRGNFNWISLTGHVCLYHIHKDGICPDSY